MSQRTWNLIEERRELNLRLLATSDETLRRVLKLQYSQICKRIYRSTRRDRRVCADNVADCAQRSALDSI